MCRREVVGRYRGSMMGIAWSFFHPILMLVVYTFVFSVVFKARWGVSQGETQADFAVILFAGMIVHGFFSESLNRAPTLILANPNYVQKVVFPLEIMPWISIGSSLFHMGVSLIVLLAFNVALTGSLPWTAVLLPVVLLPLLLATLGLGWLLSALGVYIRDIGQAIGILTTVLLFLSPVFYPMSALPEKYQLWLRLNPLAYMIEWTRGVLLWGRVPDWWLWGIYALGGLLAAWLGFWWFQRTRKGFADVI